MKVKYLGTLFAASVLSLGLVTSCATPDAGNTDVDNGTDVVEPNTDGGVVEPNTDGGVVEPVDPGVGEVDPNADR
jgi:hypothetical protein